MMRIPVILETIFHFRVASRSIVNMVGRSDFPDYKIFSTYYCRTSLRCRRSTTFQSSDQVNCGVVLDKDTSSS